MDQQLEVCQQAARAGGAELLRWRDRFEVREKGPADLVTQADVASQNVIRAVLLDRFPDHRFLGEEDVPEASGDSVREGDTSEYQWIVDPLDGTTNYVHGLPSYSVSIALRRGNELLVGAVYDPVADEMYTAIRGGGAFLNGRPVRPSDVSHLGDALVAVSFPAKASRDSREVDNLLRVLPRCQSFRRLGSAALNLCYVGSGRLDAYWSTSTKIWDIAAGALVVEEAGGLVTALDGGPLDLVEASFLSANGGELHRQLCELLE